MHIPFRGMPRTMNPCNETGGKIMPVTINNDTIPTHTQHNMLHVVEVMIRTTMSLDVRLVLPEILPISCALLALDSTF